MYKGWQSFCSGVEDTLGAISKVHQEVAAKIWKEDLDFGCRVALF